MNALIKSTLIFILCSTLPVISYAADKSKYCPESENIDSYQGLHYVTIEGRNFANEIFKVKYHVDIGPNDAPHIWYDNFKYSSFSYDQSTKSLACTYTATRHVATESSKETSVTITNIGAY